VGAVILQAIFFYIFAVVCIASAVMVVAARNPVHSVLFLILAFVNAAGLFVLMGAEFLAMILVVVYVGAVAVLFLFVVMMLDVDFAELKRGVLDYLPVGGAIGVVMMIELVFIVVSAVANPDVARAITAPIPNTAEISNSEALGLVLYTRYVYFFETAGLILLVAMIGAIMLTLHHRPDVKRQSIAAQNARRKSTAMEVVKVKAGQGLS
jgi:NADH-quinone oxidoreductase subunit J